MLLRFILPRGYYWSYTLQ